LARSSTKKKSIVEHCWTLVGQHRAPFWLARRMKPTRGEPASVEFDAAWALLREETRGDVVGFYHTHPAGPPEPSARDHRTMRAWVSSLGKPLLCLIESEGKLAAYCYEDDNSSGTRLKNCQLFPRGMVVALE
jgi:proteasome lid subunit RPN8/RPN11